MKKRKRKLQNTTGVSAFTPEKPNGFRTVKCSLHTILRDKTYIQDINDIVIKCNHVVTEAYQFIRLYCLMCYEKNLPLPSLDETFIQYCLKVTGKRDARGRKAQDTETQQALETFYNEHFKEVLDHDDKFDLCNYSFLIPYLATQMHTAIHNNLKEHFVTRLLRFINKTTCDYEDNLTKEEATKERHVLKQALFENSTAVPERYAEWYTQHRQHIIPDSWNVSLPYDVKVQPERYLPYTFYMNKVLETNECKLFQPLSLRNSIAPHYVNFDTAALINFFAKKGEKGALLRQVKLNQERFWNRIFNLDLRIFHHKRYLFNYTLQTDGVGVSLLFVHREYDKKKKVHPEFNEGEEMGLSYVDELNEEDLKFLKNKNVVGIDPGKYNLVYMADGEKKLRYTAFQRRAESMAKRNQKILRQEKLKNDIIVQETLLSDYNSKTVDISKFKEYLKAKNKLNSTLRPFYEQELHRKMKFRQCVYTRKSEDHFLNRIVDTFGKDAVMAYGDWSRSSQMKHFVPTKGVGLRKLIAKKFTTVLVNEFRTSKLCCGCHKELCHLHVKQNNTTKKLFRCLVCNECESSESKQPVFVTRDLNSALNIRQLTCRSIVGLKRPKPFCRDGNGLAFTSETTQKTASEGKVGQSVDFAVRNGTNPCQNVEGRRFKSSRV